MFDFENPFKVAADIAAATEQVEELTACDLETADTEPDWENAEWEEVCSNPQHQAEGAERAARAAALENQCDTMAAQHQQERAELFGNFYENEYRRRRERTLIKALRYGALAVGCGLLTYVCCDHSISWLAWLLGSAGVVFSTISGYGFGIAREMSR